MSQAVIDLCGSDSENEGHHESTSKRGLAHDDVGSYHDKSLDNKSASCCLDKHDNNHSTFGKTESLRENTLLGCKRLLELSRNCDSDEDEDSIDSMALPVSQFKIVKKSNQMHGTISKKRIEGDVGRTNDSEFLRRPEKESNFSIEILDDTMDQSMDDSILHNVDGTFHSPMSKHLPVDEVQTSIQTTSDAINSGATQCDNSSTRYTSWNKENESNDNDDCIILFSSDDEKEENGGSPMQSTNKISNVKLYLNESSDSDDDDVLPSPAPFQRKVTFDLKMNQGQRLDKGEGPLSEETERRDKGYANNDNDDDDDESISSVVSWHFVTQQDPDDNIASNSQRIKVYEQNRTKGVDYSCSDTDEDELLSQQMFKSDNHPNYSDQLQKENRRRGEESDTRHNSNSNVASTANPLQIDLNMNSSHVTPLEGLDLMSPVASIGRPSVGSAYSSSSTRKLKVPIPAIPVANEIGGKLYPDLRNLFIRELIKHARNLRRFIYQKGALDGTIRAINDLALYAFPIRTAEAATCIKGIGGELIGVLKDAQNSLKKNQTPYEPPLGKFSCAAAAALVVLLSHERDKTGDDRYLSMEDLLNKVNEKVHCPSGGGKIFNQGVEYYLNKTNLDPNWMQVSTWIWI